VPITPAPVETSRGESVEPAAHAPDPRASVTVDRQHPDDARQRQVMVRIDDGPTATLVYGDRIALELAPGAHVLRANNTLFWKRVPFTVEPGEHVAFTLINKTGRMTLGLLALLGAAPLFLQIDCRRERRP